MLAVTGQEAIAERQPQFAITSCAGPFNAAEIRERGVATGHCGSIDDRGDVR